MAVGGRVIRLCCRVRSFLVGCEFFVIGGVWRSCGRVVSFEGGSRLFRG